MVALTGNLTVPIASGNTTLGPHTNITPTVLGYNVPQVQTAPSLTSMATAPDLATSMSSGYIDAGGNYVSGTSAPADPYAAWGGTAAYNNLVNGFTSQKNNIYGSASDAATNTGINLNNSILDLIDSMKVGQMGIDDQATNNELAKMRGTSDVYGGVNRGIASGRVLLAGKNASDSSAADAIARAYGQIGQRQLAKVGNEYALQNDKINLSQADLNRQEAAGVRRITGSKEMAINDIVSQASDKLAALDAAMANANLPDRLALDAEKTRVRNDVVSRLAAYDAMLTNGLSGIVPTDQNARIAEATRRNTLGMSPTAKFDVSMNTPVVDQSANVGADLPIYTYRSNKNE